MVLIDIHSHMDFNHFDNDRINLIEEMKKNNIITLSNTLNQENYNYSKELFKKHNDVIKVCPGLYPIEAQKISNENFNNYIKQIKKEKNDILAIGEIGLDLKHGSDNKEFKVQVQRFKSLIELGIELNKPMIIHTWGAEQEVLEIIEEYVLKTNFNKFILHCFTGKKKLIKKIKELKIYASVPLIILNTQSFQSLVEILSIRNLFIETDSPYLNPDKTRNSPLNIPKIYEKIAQIKKYDTIEIENIIYRNYQKVFL
ncbi:MAG: TatD family hydrolase [Nanoarchaeota archaeon]